MQANKFIDEHRDPYDVESMCMQLHMEPSTYYAHQQCKRHPEMSSPRIKREEALCGHIQRIWHDNYGVYGARKIWRALLLVG